MNGKPRGNVILEQHGDAVQRTARGLSLGVKRVSDRQRIGIQFDDRVERWSLPVESFDAVEVHFRQPSRSVLARIYFGLQFGDGQFIHFETSHDWLK